MLGSTALV